MCKVFSFSTWKGLGQGAGSHMVCWTLNELDSTGLDNVANIVVAQVNVLRAGVIMTVLRQRNCRFAIAEEIKVTGFEI
jgi:hypothetical protein